MKDFLTEFCLAGAALMFVAWVVLANRRRIASAADALAKISRARIAAFLAFAAIATVCAQKRGGTNDPPQGGDSPDVVQEGDMPRSGGGEAAMVTNLCFTGISVSSNEAVLALAWPTNFLSEGSCLDFFAKVGSLTNDWGWIGCQTVSDGDTNIEVSVLLADLPGTTNAAPSAAFFRVADRATYAATMRDWDGDGIPDVYELHNGTNPYVPDAALAPRLTVGDGGDYADLASALAASTNYSIVSLPAGEMLLSNWIIMPGHPVLLTGPDDGYAVLRSTADVAVVVLDGGQTEETLFRNLMLVLDCAGSLQTGFWIGGSLPWSGVGASPTFENVRMRAPRPGTLYHCWHYYRDDGGASRLADCVMNAAGATSVIGVYAMGGPEVVLDGCHFVNFPPEGGNYATYFQEGTNIVAEYAAPETGLSWAGYSLDADYSATADSDGDGISDCDEVFTYDTDPWLADSDCDGISDGDEVADGTDPHVFGSFFRHVTVVVTVSDALPAVTNYVAWGVAAHGWEANDVVALAASPATNEFAVANSNATVYAKAYRDMNRNGEYDEGADILLSKAVPASATSIISFAFGDVDGDDVPDVQEIAEGTDPYNEKNYCFNLTLVENGVFSTTNSLNMEITVGGQSVFGPELATNRTWIAHVGHIVVTNGENVMTYFWDDANTNGVRDEEEPCAAQQLIPTGHENVMTNMLSTLPFDLDRDGILDWWEELHSDAGLSSTNSADARLDPDGDGLINLHEYWADCDPLTPDGSNTVLSVMARSIDERLSNTTCSCLYSNYSQSGVLNGLVKNLDNWAADVDLSCASPWNGWHANYEAGVLITRRHVLFARHYMFQHGEGNRQIYFRPRNGGVYSGVVIATNVSSSTDIAVALLSEDVPETISSASILPSDYADYISSGNGLPMLTLDFQEKTLVHDVVSFPSISGNISARYPVDPLRLVHAEPIVVGDSGNPRFLLIGATPVLVSTIWMGPNSPAVGPFLTGWKDEIQNLVDELSCNAGLSTNMYRLAEFDLSQYQKLSEGRR